MTMVRAAVAFSFLLACGKDDPGGGMETDPASTGEASSTGVIGCTRDDECPMGAQCDLESGECVGPFPTPDSTEDPAPPDFAEKVIPFFRGKVCTVQNVQAGASFPVYVNPCLHPCIGASAVDYRQVWNCDEQPCRAYVVMWVTGDSIESCPEDAFGRFEKELCVNMTPIEFQIDPNVDGEPIAGEMRLEIPYLSNEDIEMIAAAPDDVELREELMSHYLPDENRKWGMMDIAFNPLNPPPPETCSVLELEECQCHDVGF